MSRLANTLLSVSLAACAPLSEPRDVTITMIMCEDAREPAANRFACTGDMVFAFDHGIAIITYDHNRKRWVAE